MKWGCVHSCRRRTLHRGPSIRARWARQRHGARDVRVGSRRMYVDRIALYRAPGPLPYPVGPLGPPATVTPGQLLASKPYHPQASGYDTHWAPPTRQGWLLFHLFSSLFFLLFSFTSSLLVHLLFSSLPSSLLFFLLLLCVVLVDLVYGVARCKNPCVDSQTSVCTFKTSPCVHQRFADNNHMILPIKSLRVPDSSDQWRYMLKVVHLQLTCGKHWKD